MAASALENPDAERRIVDAAHVLLDACHGASPRGAGRATMLATAVQVIFMADDILVGAPACARTVTVGSEDTLERFYGLGVGAGSLLALMMASPGAVEASLKAFNTGLAKGIDDRVTLSRRTAGPRR